METFDSSEFSGIVPVFPLPDVVLFPSTLLPLHIFEPRYRQMTRTALEGEKVIAMALLKPGWESDYYGNPPIHDVVGLGRIIQENELPDGKFNLLLFGVSRARVVRIVSDTPYRTAEVEVLEESLEGVDPASLERKRQALLDRYSNLLRPYLKGGDLKLDLPLSALCDLLASIALRDAQERQRLLETLDVATRCDRILEIVTPPIRRPPGAPSLN